MYKWVWEQKQWDRLQWTYHVILRCGRATIVAVGKQITYPERVSEWVSECECVCVCVCVCVCILRYPAYNVQAPYCHLRLASLYNIFPQCLRSSTIFEDQLLNTKCVLVSSTTFIWNISHSKKKWARYDKKNVYWSSCRVSYSCPILIKL